MIEDIESQSVKVELPRTDATLSELQILAEDKSLEILQKINVTMERIAGAKQEAELAKAMKSGLFGKTGKKLDATTNALVETNEAVSEMNNLLQDSIRFTCSSIQFAQVMHKTMAYMMVNGFKDANGEITKISINSKEFVQIILDEAEDFVKKQLAVEETQAEIQRKLFEKDKIDKEQEKDIQFLLNYAKKKDILDKEQNENIQKIIDGLKASVVGRKIDFAFSITALLISIGTLTLFFLHLFSDM
jgi:hypothetical protein